MHMLRFICVLKKKISQKCLSLKKSSEYFFLVLNILEALFFVFMFKIRPELKIEKKICLKLLFTQKIISQICEKLN